jgi:hypothetical protein
MHAGSSASAHPDPSEDGRDRRTAGYFVAALLSAAAVAGILVVLLAEADDRGSTAAATGAFGAHYKGLEDRRVAAGVPTMSDGGGEHFHPELSVYVRGEEIQVPPNVGIDPARPPALMAGLHTHDASGIIHNEAGTGATLGDFFAVWGVPFSAEELGPYEASESEEVRLWVDGEPSDAYGDLELADGQEIVVAYGDVPASAIE